MDDKDLMSALDRLPLKCVVLLEDVDCAGADVEDRDAKGKDKINDHAWHDPMRPIDAAHEAIFERLITEHAVAQEDAAYELLKVKEILTNQLGVDIDTYQVRDKRRGQMRIVPAKHQQKGILERPTQCYIWSGRSSRSPFADDDELSGEA